MKSFCVTVRLMTSHSVRFYRRRLTRTLGHSSMYVFSILCLQINGKFLSLFGNKPAELIVETAHKEKVDMVVIGSRGSGKLRRTILGSISDYVLHHAHCAVTICRKEHHHHGLLHKFIKPRSRTSSTCSTSSNP